MEVISGPARAHAAIRAEIAVSRAARDCAFLAAVVVISLLPYVHGLGFYYDDYSVLQRMHAAADQSLAGVYDAVRPATGQRPLQALTFALLYQVFGLDPLGYHVVNAFLLVGVATVLYLVLRELRLPRIVCVSVPLVYSVLPHYATNRFWLNAFQITLSILFYLVSSYGALRALRARPLPRVAWLTLALACVAGSLFAYELVYPLFALNVGLVWWAGGRTEGEVPSARRLVAGALCAAIVVVGVAKTALVAEHGQNAYRLGIQDGLAHHLAYLVSGSIKVNAGTYFLALPYVIWWILRHRFDLADAGVALCCGLLALVYVRWIARSDPAPLEDARVWRRSAIVGGAAFVLGYAVFLTNQRVLFRSAGIDNRVNAAAALGVVAVLVGSLGWIATSRFVRRRAVFLSTSVGCVVAVCVLVVECLGGFWTEAARRQHSIVSDLRRAQPVLPAGTTVVLDGVCPETGPAVVFGDQGDSRSALRLAYGDPSLVADNATGGMRNGKRRLVLTSTFLGRQFTRKYAYGPRLLVFDFPQRTVDHIRGRRDAVRYISGRQPPDCQPQRGFAWGFDPFSRTSLP